jgi:enterochelin esterase-like enzyme
MPIIHAYIKRTYATLLILFLLAACIPATQTPTPTIKTTSAGWEIITPHPIKSATPTATAMEKHPGPTKPAGTPIALPIIPTITCKSDAGEVRLDGFESEILGAQFEFRIYLPPCYGSDQDLRYPVLYLLHGLYATDEQWDRIGVDETADALITSGEIAPMMIVMPGETSFPSLDTSKFDEVVTSELIPWVDAHYQSIPERSSRVIGGLSRGAAWAMRIGVENWQSFSAIGAHSLPIVSTEGHRLLLKLKEIPLDDLPRLFIDIGDRDPELPYTQAFEDALTEADIPHVWYLFLGRHEEPYWEKHLEVYLRWYAETW